MSEKGSSDHEDGKQRRQSFAAVIIQERTDVKEVCKIFFTMKDIRYYGIVFYSWYNYNFML